MCISVNATGVKFLASKYYRNSYMETKNKEAEMDDRT